jgi:hypothetical protein
MLKFDGKRFSRADPEVKINKNDNGGIESFEINARSNKELKAKINEISQKYGIDKDSIVTDEFEHPSPVEESEFVLDSDGIHRDIAKIAYGFACWKLPSTIILSDAFARIRMYLKGDQEDKLVSSNYTYTDFMSDNRRPLHKVHIAFNRSEGLVTGFVTLFGAFRYTILLSDSYSGDIEWPSIDYTFNPVTQNEVFGNSVFTAPKLTINQIVNPKQRIEKVTKSLEVGTC